MYHVVDQLDLISSDKELDEDMEDDLDIPDLTDNTVDVTPKITEYVHQFYFLVF